MDTDGLIIFNTLDVLCIEFSKILWTITENINDMYAKNPEQNLRIRFLIMEETFRIILRLPSTFYKLYFNII